VEYGRYRERKLKSNTQFNDSATSSNYEPIENQTITDKLIKIMKLFNVFASTTDEDQAFRSIMKSEIDNLLKDSLTMSFHL
jgi:hypothetical protein